MYKFKLLSGKHTGWECDKNGKLKTVKVPGPDGTEVEQRVPRTYKAGETIISHVDLIELLGPNKFERLSAPRHKQEEDENASIAPEANIAPGGQVSSGKQVTVRLPDGSYASVVETALNRPKTAEDKAKAESRYVEEQDDNDDEDEDEEDEEEDDEEGNSSSLEDKTFDELQEIASREGVNVKGLRSKKDVAAAIQAARDLDNE